MVCSLSGKQQENASISIARKAGPSAPLPSPSLPLARLTPHRRAHYGARWRRTPSEQLTKAMRDKLNGYRGNLMQVCLAL